METKDLILLILIPIMLMLLVTYTNKDIITGAVVSEEKESNIIGIYSIMPSFKVKVDYDLNDYTQIKELLGFIMDCSEKGNDIKACIIQEESKNSNFQWSLGCDKGAEKVLYDFAEFYQNCINSEDINCVCRKNLELPAEKLEEYGLANKRYEMTLSEVGLEPYRKIRIKMSNPEIDLFYDIDKQGIGGWFPYRYFISYTNQNLNNLNMIFKDDISDKIVPGLGLMSEILVYKNDNNPNKIKSADFVREDDDALVYPNPKRNIKKPENLHDCMPNQQNTIRFCVTKKDSKLLVYDKAENKVEHNDVVYKFAVAYPLPTPKPAIN